MRLLYKAKSNNSSIVLPMTAVFAILCKMKYNFCSYFSVFIQASSARWKLVVHQRRTDLDVVVGHMYRKLMS